MEHRSARRDVKHNPMPIGDERMRGDKDLSSTLLWKQYEIAFSREVVDWKFGDSTSVPLLQVVREFQTIEDQETPGRLGFQDCFRESDVSANHHVGIMNLEPSSGSVPKVRGGITAKREVRVAIVLGGVLGPVRLQD